MNIGRHITITRQAGGITIKIGRERESAVSRFLNAPVSYSPVQVVAVPAAEGAEEMPSPPTRSMMTEEIITHKTPPSNLHLNPGNATGVIPRVTGLAMLEGQGRPKVKEAE